MAVMPALPNDETSSRLLGIPLPERNDEGAVQRARDLTPETIVPMGENAVIRLPAVAP